MRKDKMLLQKTGRLAGKMREEDYEKLSVFIISMLERAGQEGVTLHELVQEAQQKFNTDFHGNVSWYLLEVKYELELRKVILKTISPTRAQTLRLNPEKKWWFN